MITFQSKESNNRWELHKSDKEYLEKCVSNPICTVVVFNVLSQDFWNI